MVIVPPRKYTAPGKVSTVFENSLLYKGMYITGISVSTNPIREHILPEIKKRCFLKPMTV